MATLEQQINRSKGISGKALGRFSLRKLTALHAAAHLLAWVPLAWLILDAQAGNLSVNPIQEATQRMGRAAILLLMASLAVTPVRLLTGLRSVQTLARPLGLYAFFYALFHLFVYVGVDYGFDFALILPDVVDKKYIYIGLSAFLILLALAVTSFRWWMKRLGKHWKHLHRLVYLAGVLVVIHYAMAVKGDFLRLQGDIGMPLLYAGLVIFLLAVRHPRIRRPVVAARERVREGIRRIIPEDRNAV